MTQKLDTLEAALLAAFGDTLKATTRALGEITITVPAAAYAATMQRLRDDPSLKFEQLMDLCGLDYSDYKNQPWDGPRYAVVAHLLSITHNCGCVCVCSRPMTNCRRWLR